MYAVTAATGQLGTLVVDRLLERVRPDRIVAAVHDPARAAAHRARGVHIREADYDRPDTLRTAFAGVDRLLLISGPELGRRVIQHRAAIDAARDAGVGRIAYTSLLHADTSPLAVAPDHRDTEAALAASGVPHVILRNGWYTENRLAFLPTWRRAGVITGAAGDGRFGTATRADYAAAAAAALLADTLDRRIHELAGDDPWTLTDLAAELSRRTGQQISYRDLPRDTYQAELTAAGLPARLAELLAHADAVAATGAMADDSRDLDRLIGHPTTPLASAIVHALADHR